MLTPELLTKALIALGASNDSGDITASSWSGPITTTLLRPDASLTHRKATITGTASARVPAEKHLSRSGLHPDQAISEIPGQPDCALTELGSCCLRQAWRRNRYPARL